MGCTGHGQAGQLSLGAGNWVLEQEVEWGGREVGVLVDGAVAFQFSVTLSPPALGSVHPHQSVPPPPTPSAHSLPSADPRAASSANPQLGAGCREREGLSAWSPPLGPQPHPSQHPHPHLQYRKPLSQDPGQGALGILPLPLQQPCPVLVWMMGDDSRARAGATGWRGVAHIRHDLELPHIDELRGQ